MDSIEWSCPICEADNSICGCEAKNHMQQTIEALTKELADLKEKVIEHEIWLRKMIKGGEITTQFAKGDDYHASNGAYTAFKSCLDKLLKEN